ncbi:MAG: hypothetical protein O6944_02810 [Gammaproteobacteria bacterium]|nr:hypothetical protein [Gammaproteobacteria bacterium]
MPQKICEPGHIFSEVDLLRWAYLDEAPVQEAWQENGRPSSNHLVSKAWDVLGGIDHGS